MSMQTTNGVTVVGSFGLGNIGDDAVPLAIQDLAAAQGRSMRVDVISRFDVVDDPDVISLGPHDEQRRERAARQRLLLIGGGVIEPSPRAVVARTRHLLRSRGGVALLGAGVEAGVAYPWWVRRGIRGMLRKCDRYYVRDVLSADVLMRIFPRRRIELSGDCVIWLKAAQQLPEEVESLGPFITVALAPRWTDDAFTHWLADHLVTVARGLDMAVVFVPCSVQHDDDRLMHQAVAARIKARDEQVRTICIERALAPREVAAVIGKSSVMIGMRLHACVLAFSQRCPCVGLVYHPKLTGFAKTVGWERFFIPSGIELRQSTDAYGFSFARDEMTRYDLTQVVHAALAEADFNRLDVLRKSVSDAFAAIVDSDSRE